MATTVKVTRDVTGEKLDGLDVQIEQFVKKGVDLLEERVKSEMKLPKTGRLYLKGKTKREHIASAPGESPAVDSSNLITNIVQVELQTLERVVGTNVFYAPFLEDGTSRMEARPVWETTLMESLPTLEAMLKEMTGGRGRLTT